MAAPLVVAVAKVDEGADEEADEAADEEADVGPLVLLSSAIVDEAVTEAADDVPCALVGAFVDCVDAVDCVGAVISVDAVVADAVASIAEDGEGRWRQGPAMAPIGARRYARVTGFIV